MLRYTQYTFTACTENVRDVQWDRFTCLVGTLTRRAFQKIVSMEFGAGSVTLAGLALIHVWSAEKQIHSVHA